MHFLWRALSVSISLTLLCILIFIVAIQQYRQGLNDPQVQVATDVALRIEAGASPKTYIPPQTHDIERSLATFITMFDDTQTLIGSSGYLEDSPVTPPVGVFGAAKEFGESRVTWEPAKGVRIAAVVRHVLASSTTASTSVYVLVGRNMREVETRISRLARLMVAGWLIILSATLASMYWTGRRERQHV